LQERLLNQAISQISEQVNTQSEYWINDPGIIIYSLMQPKSVQHRNHQGEGKNMPKVDRVGDQARKLDKTVE
ncbi:hypothetical protein, partial [Pseudomonas oryzihabitans]|uniref:hypothetical protein n=1 Tax=Pseudomonas oryzihabitans TaxID=47885 RepID=UPI002B1CE757